MSGTTSGMASGLVIGLAGVLLAQQLGVLELSVLVHAIEYLLAGALIGAVLFGLVGRSLARRAGAGPAP